MWYEYTFHFDPLKYFGLGLFLQTLLGGVRNLAWHSVHLLVVLSN